MNMLKLALRSLNNRPWNTALSIIILAFGLALISVLFNAQGQLEKSFNRNIEGINMVVGAKGSPLQLILSSVYHLDAPTGNIKLSEFNQLAKNPMVAKAIPLSLGDNYRGFRIVGTRHSYPEHYNLTLAQGENFASSLEVNIGATVAEETGLGLGDRFSGNHGLKEEGHQHDQVQYVVKGIYEVSGTALDRLILTPLESVWKVHDHGNHDEHSHEEDLEITSGLLQFKSAMATFRLPRMVNEKTNMQAALPAIEINRLFTLTENASRFLQALALLLIILAALSVFAGLYQNLKDEEPQLAFLRAIGAPPSALTGLIISKSILLCFFAYLLSLLISVLALWLMSYFFHDRFDFELTALFNNAQQLLILGGTLLLGLLSSLLPAWQAFRLNISKTLRNG